MALTASGTSVVSLTGTRTDRRGGTEKRIVRARKFQARLALWCPFTYLLQQIGMRSSARSTNSEPLQAGFLYIIVLRERLL